ncbi:hypothetical protein [Ruminococcus albus]|uniref:DUF3848 domain-containing protein n=1 Tax=Ruminococcus albus TaxID=1264 RepID=A0A1I1M5J2_RUMAL|nr:hypothetical protein [Ruminococcus albus]SFC80767.1 hypothetical protein SAMN02910406_02428 [Ruminococcus albus]
MKNSVDMLVGKINREYETMRKKWWDMTADELIYNAERIAAAKFIKENIVSCISDDEAKYLLRFKEPLAAVIETILYRYEPQNIAEREWFSDHLYDLLDKRELDCDFEAEATNGMTML